MILLGFDYERKIYNKVEIRTIMLDIDMSSIDISRLLKIEQSWLLQYGTDFYDYLNWLHNDFDWDL